MLKEQPSFKVVGEAHNGEEAVALCRQLLPDVVLMDLTMPGMDGLTATTKILRVSPESKILILTAREDAVFSKRLLQIGAAGYITKDASVTELIRAIRLVQTGQRYISPAIATQLAMQEINPLSEPLFTQLSGRELEIVIMITRGEKVPHIATQLCISPKTVNSYRYRIFDKLNIHNDVALTHLAVKCGVLENLETVKE